MRGPISHRDHITEKQYANGCVILYGILEERSDTIASTYQALDLGCA
jgi:hypothetical protein